MSSKIKRPVKKKIKQAPPMNPGAAKFVLKTEKSVQNIKATTELHVPTKAKLPDQQNPGEIIYNSTSKKFYGSNGTGWGSINTAAPSLAQVLNSGNNAGGESITNVNLVKTNQGKFTTISSTSATISSQNVPNLFANSLTASNISSSLSQIQNLYINNLFSENISVGTITSENLNFPQIFTGTLTATFLLFSSSTVTTTTTTYIDTFTSSNYLWNFGNTFTISKITVTNNLTATNFTGTIVPQNITATFANIKDLNTLTASFSGTVFMDNSNISANNIYTRNFMATLGTGINATSVNLLVDSLKATFSGISTLTAANSTAFTLTSDFLSGKSIYINSLSATSVSLSTVLNVNNLYSNTLNANLLEATFGSATLAVFTTVFANYLTNAVIDVKTLTTNSLTISGFSAATISGNSLLFSSGEAIKLILSSDLNVTNLQTDYVSTGIITATIVTASTLLVSNLYTNVTNGLFADMVYLTESIITADSLSGTIIKTTFNVANSLSANTISLNNLSVENCDFTNVYTANTTSSLATVTGTLSAQNISGLLVNIDNTFTFTTMNALVSNYVVTSTVYNFYGSTLVTKIITATNIYGGDIYANEFLGNFVGNFVNDLEEISYPTWTLSTFSENSVILSGEKGKANWGARVAGVSYDLGTSVAINSDGDIVISGVYISSPLVIYNAGGTLSNISLPNSADTADAFVVKWNVSGNAQWAARVAGDLYDNGTCIAINNSGDIIATGYYGSSPLLIYNAGGTLSVISLDYSGTLDAFIVKWDSEGTADWAARVTGINIDIGNGVATNNSRDIVMTGYYYSSPLEIYNAGRVLSDISLPNSGNSDAFIIKWNYTGVAQWATRVENIGTTTQECVDMNNFGDIVASGHYYSSPLLIYNAGGTFSNISLPNSDYTLDAFIVKWDSEGIAKWGARVAGVLDDYGRGISINDHGDIVASGYYYSSPLQIYNAGGTLSNISLPNTDTINAFIVKWNSIGQAQWGARLGGPNGDIIGNSIAINNIGDIVATGYFSSSPLQIYNAGGTLSVISLPYSGSVGVDAFIIKWNSIGEAQWAAQIAGIDGDDTGNSVSLNNKGEIVIAGSYYPSTIQIYNANGSVAFTLPNTASSSDAFIVKYVDETITTALPNPSGDAQPKTIVSAGPQTVITLSSQINGQSKSIFIKNGESVQMVYDAVGQNWIVASLTGTLI